MLTSAQFLNYKCFPSANVPLRPLTVLIGPNDSGKTSFLTGLLKVCNGRLLGFPDDAWRYNGNVDETASGTSFVAAQADRVGGRTTFRHAEKGSLPDAIFIQMTSEGINMQSPGYEDAKGVQQLSGGSACVPSLYDFVLRHDRSRFDRMLNAARHMIPGLNDIQIITPHPSERALRLVIDGGFVIDANRASTGVRLALFFIALAYHPKPAGLILLEEPETGLHPGRLEAVLRLIRAITTGEFGANPAQVVLSTHSPYLLDWVNPESDQILIFRRLSNGERQVDPVDTRRLAPFMSEFMLGEVWFNRGEEGLIRTDQ